MVQFGAHAFVWISEWSEAQAQQAALQAAEAGLDFLEIPLLHPEEINTSSTRQLLKELNLGVTCSLGLPKEASLPTMPEQALAFLKKALAQAEALGSPVLTGVLYSTLGELSGHPPQEEELDTIAHCLKQVAREAALLGLRIGLEPVNRYETYLINTAAQGLDLLRRIDAPNVFLHLDTYHMNIEEKGFKKPILLSEKALGYIHLSESDRGTPGQGNVAWEDVFSSLQAIGYTGPLVLESFVAPNPDIARATCIWRPVEPEPSLVIREGLPFLKTLAARYLA
jgi:D-psicose/D-tagatose/L-ribulose 3-epimerase